MGLRAYSSSKIMCPENTVVRRTPFVHKGL